MNWDLQTIRSRLRELTGRSDSNVVLDAALDDEINAYYRFIFPDEVNVHEFYGWTTFNTAAGTEDYSQPAAVQAVEAPLYLKDSAGAVYDLLRYVDPALFKADYPDDAHDATNERDRPSGMLVYARTFSLRPIADDVYTVTYASMGTQPTALTNDGDTPDDEKWGPMIATGAAIEYFKIIGAGDEAQELNSIYEFYKNSVSRKQLRQFPLGKRAATAF